jgi:hypothetical protein
VTLLSSNVILTGSEYQDRDISFEDAFNYYKKLTDEISLHKLCNGIQLE